MIVAGAVGVEAYVHVLRNNTPPTRVGDEARLALTAATENSYSIKFWSSVNVYEVWLAEISSDLVDSMLGRKKKKKKEKKRKEKKRKEKKRKEKKRKERKDHMCTRILKLPKAVRLFSTSAPR